MKKITLFLVFAIICSVEMFAQLRVTDEGYVQVDYPSGSDAALTLGDNPYAPQPRGRWAVEHWNGGVNFYIPWPNAGGGSYYLFLEDATGYVGVNESNPDYELDVNGDIQLSGQIRYSSDERLKTEIKDIGSIIDKVKNLNGVSYKMKKSAPKEYDLFSITDPLKLKAIEAETARYDSIQATDRYGFIAQDLQEVFPELVDEDEEGFLNVDYVGLIPILVEAIKELETRVETMESTCCNQSDGLKSAQTGSTQLSSNSAKLYQNAPNPFSVQTTIQYEIPESVQNAQLHICNMTGSLLKTIDINQKGSGNVIISASEFSAGMYLYSLVSDGKIVDTKQMLLTE